MSTRPARVEQVRVGAVAAATHPPAELVELAEAQEVRAVDDERVDRRHVDARLDDRRAHEHVAAPLPEVVDDALEGPLVHLAVRDHDPGLGHELAHAPSDVLDVAHAVVHEERLALAEELTAQRLGDGALVELADVGEDRLAVRRRRLDHREVADAGERHLERARDGARREGEHVDAGREPLHRLFVGDAEALLLVDDEEPEVLERDVLGEQPVRADHDVDGAVRDAVDDRARLGVGEEPAEQLHAHGVARVAVRERLEVLAREQRRRHQDGGLLGVLHALEHGADRDLGLAEADVGAHEPVHRPRRLHVGLHVVDRVQLVDGLGEREERLDLALPRRVGREGVARRSRRACGTGRRARRRSRPAAALARAVVRCQSAPPILDSVGVSPPEYAVIASIWSVGRYSRSVPRNSKMR